MMCVYVVFALHPVAYSSGVDVNALLSKIGLTNTLTGATSERIGRVAIAYAAHKVRSFPSLDTRRDRDSVSQHVHVYTLESVEHTRVCVSVCV